VLEISIIPRKKFGYTPSTSIPVILHGLEADPDMLCKDPLRNTIYD